MSMGGSCLARLMLLKFPIAFKGFVKGSSIIATLNLNLEVFIGLHIGVDVTSSIKVVASVKDLDQRRGGMKNVCLPRFI
jgi:hypothetical protein